MCWHLGIDIGQYWGLLWTRFLFNTLPPNGKWIGWVSRWFGTYFGESKRIQETLNHFDHFKPYSLPAFIKNETCYTIGNQHLSPREQSMTKPFMSQHEIGIW